MTSLLRLIYILHIVCKYHLEQLLTDVPNTWVIRLGIKLIPSYWMYYFSAHRSNNPEQNAKEALITLGPIFIKLGQLIATRRDLINDSLADELETLTEQVPPFDSKIAINILEEELGEHPKTLFASFSEEPLASASIAQVHCAELKSGEQVVLKVVRPGIEKIVRRDISLMASFAKIIEKLIPETKLFFISQLVENYKEVIHGEINLTREAANTIKFRKNAEQHQYLYIPKIYLDFCTRKVMCVERIYGIPINQSEKIEAQGTDLKKLAENGVKIFFTQVFRDNFFHADMHPGNIFVNTVHPEANQYASIDCAIAASLSKEDQLFIGQQVIALVQKNYSQNAQLFIDAGWVDKSIHKEELALRLQKVAEPIFDRPMNEIEFAPILLDLFSMAREFHIKINPNFLLFQKTLIHIEGLGKQLYPELNVWDIGRPLLEDWVKELFGPSAVLNALKESGPQLIQQLPEIPSLIYFALNRLKSNDEALNNALLNQELIAIKRSQSIKNRNIVIAGALLAGAWFSSNPITLNLADLSLSTLLLSGCGLSLLTYSILRN